jgi:molybdenum cofactor synthesis domain-containing protein
VLLLEKRGGKSDTEKTVAGLKAAVVVLSDSTSGGDRKDESGRHVVERLKARGVQEVQYHILPDDPEKLSDLLRRLSDDGATDIVITTGGTGLGPRDTTPEATREVTDREVPGIAEAIRAHGQDRLPTAMLARNIAGVRGKTLIVNLPGSLKGVRDGLDAILPGIFHAVHVIRGKSHD